MPTKKIGYKDMLDLVEGFMGESGIRSYCTEICKGKCCIGCYRSKNACHKTDDRRLACSAYMCFELRNVLFDKTRQNLYHRLREDVSDGLSKAAGDSHIDIYFKPISKEVQKDFWTNRTAIMKLLDHTGKTWSKMDHIRYLISHTCSLRK